MKEQGVGSKWSPYPCRESRSTYMGDDSTQNIVFSVTYFLKLRNAMIMYFMSQSFYQQRSNWLFGHYRTFTSLLG